MLDENLQRDESRRLSQHESIKGEVHNEVHGEIARAAEEVKPADDTQVNYVAGRLKEKAFSEVVDTESELDRAKRMARISQVIDYIFGLIYGIIGLEIVLELLGARDSSGFKQLLDTIASPLLSPFRGLMPNPSIGPFHLMISFIIALVIYVLLHLAINGLLRLFVHKKTSV